MFYSKPTLPKQIVHTDHVNERQLQNSQQILEAFQYIVHNLSSSIVHRQCLNRFIMKGMNEQTYITTPSVHRCTVVLGGIVAKFTP